VDACTIVARRELARARVLVASYRAHHPESVFTVLVLDGVEGADAVEGATVITPECLPGLEIGMLAAANPPEALTVAVLPHLLGHLLGEASGAVVYLAPGLRILGPLEELSSLAAAHEIVVVSRVASQQERPTAAFGEREGGGAISHRVLAGARGSRAERLLEVWPSYFADGERAVYDWFDGIPAIGEDVAVLRDPGYGLDLWTLSASRVDNGAGRLHVEGRPARIVDFSSLDPEAPERANHARRQARLHSIPALVELRGRHAEDLLAVGYAQDARRAWRFTSLGDGTHMTEVMRKLLLEGVEEGRLSESPFTEGGREAFYAYLNEPAERGAAAGLTRLGAEIWRVRPDVQTAYPHLDGPDGSRFAAWLVAHAREDHGVPEGLLPRRSPPAEGEPSPVLDVREPLWGVNVAGFFTSELGLGEAARLLIAGLDARGVPALPVQAQLVPPCGQGTEFTYGSPADAPYPINIVCINGDMIAPFAREAGSSFFEGRHTIALWWWEVGEFPEGWAAAFEHIDEVWVGSQHIYDAIAPASPVPVVKMTMPVTLPRVPRRSRAELGLPRDGFLFLYVHDYHSTAARKNPLGLVEAFKRAFPPGGGAKLVLKSINAENVIHEHDRVVLAAAEHPDITLIDSYVSAGEKNAMIAACDCYVSLHRSEGFGLTAAEAMLLGKPVIATRYGGNLEFMSEENSYLLDWTPVAVGEDAHPYPARGVWADPDLDQAAGLMREVFEHPERARVRGERGRRDVIERHAPRVAGEAMEARLRMIYERLVRDGVRSPNLSHRPAPVYPELAELIAGEPTVEGSGARARTKRLMQRLVARLTRPFVARQRAIDTRLHDSVARLDERVYEVAQELQRRQEARFAETLAIARGLGAGVRDAQAGFEELQRLIEELDPEARLRALEQLGRELEHHLAQHRATPYVSDERGFGAWSDVAVGPVVGYRSSQTTPDQRLYIDFEATFRGPESRVRDIQRAYLPLLEGHAPVLDVGCGRGELLDLLAQDGIAASGVDMDAGMVEHARAKGHDVALGDGVEHLRGLEHGSLGAVVAIEVIEHMPYERLIEFLRLARSRLRADGVLLLETVNPHAVDAMKAFWVDPTHQHPVFPEVALELCRLAGFHEAFWFHPIGTGEFEVDRNNQSVYAIAARTGAVESAADAGDS
jgi:glycosyltransferase involved in cell wall biosynthesis/2-polyprenyl-3-methyl-5-hydroxy-6-metoxy-1,4-benzoquinol methylase